MAANVTSTSASETLKEGFLYKWTNYIKGYQKRWFVLSNVSLSYYRSQSEVGRNCRGRISLTSAVIYPEDNCNFTISNGASQTFHLRSVNERERQEWVTALELARARAIRVQESDEEEVEYPEGGIGSDVQTVIKSISIKLDDLRTCQDLINRNGSVLHRSLAELEAVFQALIHSASNGGHSGATPHSVAAALAADGPNLLARLKTANERVTLFKITSNAMINASEEFKTLAQTSSRRWTRLLEQEHEKKKQMEIMIETLAKQHSNLEKAMKKFATVSTASDDEEFYDAEETTCDGASTSGGAVSCPGKARRVSRRDVVARIMSQNDELDASEAEETESAASADNRLADETAEASNSHVPVKTSLSGEEYKLVVSARHGSAMRRTRIPERPNHYINLWSIMKNCIGKELTKIPMPVNFNEPLSMLQRLAEDFEYADLLHRAADPKLTPNDEEQMLLVAAFAVSSYSATAPRLGKPFNPLLSETYECDRTADLGWKYIAEQVLHHPPVLASHCRGRSWTSWCEFSLTSKFRGKFLQVSPLGINHLIFDSALRSGIGSSTASIPAAYSSSQGVLNGRVESVTGNHYSWNKVTTTIHNIIVGKLWIEHHGEMVITNHTTGHVCRIQFLKYNTLNFFSKTDDSKQINGTLEDKRGKILWKIAGTWDQKIMVKKEDSDSWDTIWERVLPPKENEKMYNLTELGIQLNEPEEGVAPTDSRLRPDQRLMENGEWDEANRVKGQLEERQRARWREMERMALEKDAQAQQNHNGGDQDDDDDPLVEDLLLHTPAWFRPSDDPQAGRPVHTYTGEYWPAKERKDWSRSSTQIFSL